MDHERRKKLYSKEQIKNNNVDQTEIKMMVNQNKNKFNKNEIKL